VSRRGGGGAGTTFSNLIYILPTHFSPKLTNQQMILLSFLKKILGKKPKINNQIPHTMIMPVKHFHLLTPPNKKIKLK